MQAWAALEFAFALATLIGGIALIIDRLHIIEKAEEQELWIQAKEKVASLR
jgi:hypothetical protein